MNLPRNPIVFGEVLFDCFGDECVLGGAPFNVAWHLQGFGLKPRFVSRVGDDALGAEVRARMRDWGMDTNGLQTETARPTGRVHVSLRDGQPSYAILDDQAYDAIAPQPGLDAAGSVLYHGSLALRHAPNRRTLAALRTGAEVYLDVNLRAPWWDTATLRPLLDGARWLKLNDEEFALLTETGETPADFARRLGLGAVILTRGAQGAEVHADAVRHAGGAPPAVKLVDAVGAGDAFAAVTLYGIVHAWPWTTILPRATAFAARVCGWRGALCHDRAIYEEVLSEWSRHTGNA
ncbi:PfkB family carbohydrate kinase [Acidihalobacter ferrooxydans]|uniref:Carbohydrate kinase PfkB domain-containing protein n=1 Tax=Acidihalobacter ferrooxydans TaxID=1765967 RepID=A0A1P8UJ35_9GAMM|nr:PfkB family carbohydrate kinase [Acidihalobacter ferrooxydans]APZ43830.1 hypothetical protein BW247_12630 [Acidihalobacter ferrooxydans]